VGTLGTVSRRKGSDLFLSAARFVMREEPGTEFRLVGPLADGPEEPWSRALVSSAGAAGVAHATTSEPFAELSKWDVFALPSREDPFPLAVLEAMASGLPVVASATDGIAEQVTDETGILVPGEDTRALADGILDLLRSPGKRARMGSAGRRRVLERFTLERQAEGLDRAYARVTAGGAP
jgi:glycosyltransferase involved in cell wall biosynthesis